MAEVKLNPEFRSFGTLNVFASSMQLFEYFENYIDWCKDNYLEEEVVYGTKGGTLDLKKMHAPSIEGFARYMRTTLKTIRGYRVKGEDYADALDYIEESLHAITYSAAAAGILKEGIVSKKLKLAQIIEDNKTEKRIVILMTPDNKRSLPVEDDTKLLEATFSLSPRQAEVVEYINGESASSPHANKG